MQLVLDFDDIIKFKVVYRQGDKFIKLYDTRDIIPEILYQTHKHTDFYQNDIEYYLNSFKNHINNVDQNIIESITIRDNLITVIQHAVDGKGIGDYLDLLPYNKRPDKLQEIILDKTQQYYPWIFTDWHNNNVFMYNDQWVCVDNDDMIRRHASLIQCDGEVIHGNLSEKIQDLLNTYSKNVVDSVVNNVIDLYTRLDYENK